MTFFLVLLGASLLLAGAWWLDKRREADLVARLEKLRDCPEAAAALIDMKIDERKRETEVIQQLQKYRPNGRDGLF